MRGNVTTPLVRKLGIKPGSNMLLVNEPDHYLELLDELPEGIKIHEGLDHPPYDFIHLFAGDKATMYRQLSVIKGLLDKQGMLWVSWIKKASEQKTDITQSNVQQMGLQAGLVDVKICSVDKDWSALKFVYRKEDR